MRDLTRWHEEILNLVREWIETAGLPPTRADYLLTAQLLPENPDFESIVVDRMRQERIIEGIAVGVIRNGTSL